MIILHSLRLIFKHKAPLFLYNKRGNPMETIWLTRLILWTNIFYIKRFITWGIKWRQKKEGKLKENSELTVTKMKRNYQHRNKQKGSIDEGKDNESNVERKETKRKENRKEIRTDSVVYRDRYDLSFIDKIHRYVDTNRLKKMNMSRLR